MIVDTKRMTLIISPLITKGPRMRIKTNKTYTGALFITMREPIKMIIPIIRLIILHLFAVDLELVE